MKRLISFALPALLAVTFAVPAAVNGQSIRDRESNVCSLLNERRTAVLESLDERTGEYSRRFNASLTAADLRQKEVDEVLVSTQGEFAQRIYQWHQSHAVENEDESKRAAADEFIDTLQQLISIRRQAYAQARSEYRAGLTQARQQRYGQAQERINALKSGVEQAFSQAQRACSGGSAEAGEIREEFINNLKQVRLAYAEFRRTEKSYGEQIEGLIEARKNSFAEARREFEQSFQQALGKL